MPLFMPCDLASDTLTLPGVSNSADRPPAQTLTLSRLRQRGAPESKARASPSTDTPYQEEVGKAVKQFLSEGKIKREDLFITTKVADHLHEPDDVEYSCADSLKKMQLDYVDLLLCHWPIALEKESRESGFKKDANGEV